MIRANYAGMQSDANEISKAATEYKNNVDSLYQIVDNLVENWKGSDNVSFANKVNEYKGDLKALGDIVDNYASFLKKAAGAISGAQDEISSAAGKL
ncbi:MAG: WXG100 family type VII secretion target [Bacilli bacterium]|nr:WXG100 family type VII secretion target [Bacilli bacterium]